MVDYRFETINSYDEHAESLSKRWRGTVYEMGTRQRDITKAFELAGNPKNAHVLEIGCGDGRDAETIMQFTHSYTGIDMSKQLVKIAKQHMPEAKFKVGDAVTFNYPGNLDIVFAFASLLHLNKREVATVMNNIHKSLRTGGIFFVSLKMAENYAKQIKVNQYGMRLFYFYNPKIIQDLAGPKYQTEFISEERLGKTDWFEIALRKNG